MARIVANTALSVTDMALVESRHRQSDDEVER